MKRMNDIYYAECMKCKDFHKDTVSLEDARKETEKHEKEKHDGKLVGTFGIAWNNNNE